MTDSSPEEVALGEPLSELTRQERRYLLGVSIIGITLVRTGLVPSKISALGVEFSRADQKAVLGILAVIVGYFLVAFSIYSVADFVAWRSKRREALQRTLDARWERAREREARRLHRVRDLQTESPDLPASRIVTFLSWPVSIIRAVFDFLLPVLVGAYAIVILWTAPAPLEEKTRSSLTVTGESPFSLTSDMPINLLQVK
jgi:hypothetical protein